MEVTFLFSFFFLSFFLSQSLINIICKVHTFLSPSLSETKLSRLMGKPTMWFLNRSDINRAVQPQKIARSLKFPIYEEEELYFPSSENKGTNQLRVYREADLLFVFASANCWFSHEVAQIVPVCIQYKYI